jgi:hypothetical protein
MTSPTVDTISQRWKRKPVLWYLWAALVSGVPFLSGALLLLVVVSRVRGVFQALGGALPWPTRLLLEISNLASHHWPLTALTIVLLWTGTLRYMLHGRSPVGRRTVWVACGVGCVVITILTAVLGIFNAMMLALMYSGALFDTWYLTSALVLLGLPIAGVWYLIQSRSPGGRLGVLVGLLFLGCCYVAIWSLFLPVFRLHSTVSR